MKLADINTIEKLWAVGDVYFQRAKSMNRIWQNPKESNHRRIKAYKIFIHYSIICLKITYYVNNTRKDTSNYLKGGKKIF